MTASEFTHRRKQHMAPFLFRAAYSLSLCLFAACVVEAETFGEEDPATPTKTNALDNTDSSRFRMFSADVRNRTGSIESQQSGARAIATGLCDDDNRPDVNSLGIHGIRIPPPAPIKDEQIASALMALPEPSSLTLAVLGTLLTAAMPFRHWRKRKLNRHK